MRGVAYWQVPASQKGLQMIDTEYSSQPMMEALARQRTIRFREEAAGRDPMQSKEYLQARALASELVGTSIDEWKRRHGFAGRHESEPEA